MAVLLQLPQVAAYQRTACLERARAGGQAVAFDPQEEVVSGILLARGTPVCVAGTRRDLSRWVEHLGSPGRADRVATFLGHRLGRSGSQEEPVLTALRQVLASRSEEQCRRLLRDAGLDGRIGLMTQPPLSRIVEDLSAWDRRPIPLVRRRHHPGTSQPLAFVAAPLTLSATPLVDVFPTPMRGTHTREVLERIGVQVPEGTGVVSYPAELPLWKHAVTFVRWGYFAWRSGNI